MYQILLSRYEVFHKSHDALNLINPCFRKKYIIQFKIGKTKCMFDPHTLNSERV